MNHVWLNGKFVRAEEAVLPVADHGLIYGAGFFETFRTFGGKPRDLAKHLFRLRNSCGLLGLQPDLSRVEAAVADLLKLEGATDAVFRLTVTAGVPERPGLAPVYPSPSVLLILRPLPPPLAATGAVLRVLRMVRSTPEVSPRPKSLNYLNNLLAARELAFGSEPADEGLMLTTDGHVCEGVVTNLSWLRGEVLHVPDHTLGALPGLAQHWLCAAWKAGGGMVVEARIKPVSLRDADALILSNAVRGPFRVGRLILADGSAAAFGPWPKNLERLAQRWAQADG
jgi:4-amino-4-deoxychorismate lyase